MGILLVRRIGCPNGSLTLWDLNSFCLVAWLGECDMGQQRYLDDVVVEMTIMLLALLWLYLIKKWNFPLNVYKTEPL